MEATPPTGGPALTAQASGHGTGDEPVPRPLPRHARDRWRPFLRAMGWIGLNTFGGPVAQLGIMHRETVEKRRWLTDAQFVHLVGFANVLPGPEALQVAIHLGWIRRGVAGGIAAGLLFIWPGFVSLAGLAWVYDRWGNVGWVAGALDGIRPVAVALIAFAALRLAMRSLKGLVAYALMAAAFVASFALGVPFLLLLLASGVAGLALADRRAPEVGRAQRPLVLVLLVLALAAGFLFRPGGTGPEAPAPGAAATTVEEARTPRDEGLSRQVEIAWVNLKAAAITFGGAYTLLPYLREQMVVQRGWVGDAQIADALALGETTPGPLVSFTIFLSYLAGGPLGALVACLFIFLPSFVLVLSLAGQVERVARSRAARRFLWGVSAGVIGLILAMSAGIVPLAVRGPLDMGLTVAAFVALSRLGWNPAVTVAAGAAVGLARMALGG